MNRLASLLATVSLSAILAAGPGVAQDSGWVVEATGGFLMGKNSAGEASIDELGSSVTDTRIDPLTGGYASLRIGKNILPLWDLTGRLAITDLQPGYAEYVDSFDKLGTITSDLDYQTLDLEVGYSPELDDNFDLRFFGGARGLHYSNSLDTQDKIGTSSETWMLQEHEFYGVGPRAGLEFEKRFDDSPLGFSALMGASMIIGTEHRTLTTSSSGTTTTSVGKAIANVEAQAAIDLHLGEQAKLSLGYRGEQLSGVNDFSHSGERAAGQLVHGPFVKFKAAF